MTDSFDKTIAIIDGGSSKTPEIARIVSELSYKTETVPLQNANSYLFEEAHAVILSGGPHLFTDSTETHNSLMAQFQFLENLERPTLGICLGHQAIAITFGGKVYRDIERRESDDIEILHQHPIFHNIPSNSPFTEDHCEGIWPSAKLEVLAQSEFYETEAIKVIHRPFLGVQFHPETSGRNGEILIHNFLNWANAQQN